MALLEFSNTGITALSAAVPKNVIDNYSYTKYFPAADVKEVVDKIGVKERRFADDQTTSADLCFAAAEQLITDNQINREEIELLLFVSQTPDYRMPATSIILQHRLGLPKSTIAFDINLGCSGFIYGLSVVYSLMQHGSIKKALLLDGETRSKVYSPKDRKTAFLFGDGGVAALIEKDNKFGESFFSLNSDGSRESLIKINSGGYRNPSSLESLKEKVVDEYGNIRSDEQGYMNGADVFSFVIREIPRDFKRLLEHTQVDKEQIDWFVFHQANSYINGFIAKKLKLDPARVPSTIEQFGNTSSVSIPITIVSELKEKLKEPSRLVLSGFGVGMTWATALINMADCKISSIVEV